MTELKLTQFIIPVIVLLIITACYIYYSRKVSEKNVFNKLILKISGLAFLLNLVWEIAQGPLYSGYVYDLNHISFCALASVADMLMVLLLYFAFSLFYKDPYWPGRVTIRNVIGLVLIGGIGAILGELRHLAAGSWSYSDAMPLLPYVEVGLSPVLQFMILPALIFYLASLSIRKVQ
ncbi:MAG: hypothetical protein ACNS60_10875 [Candidatus Cyclobacteriaceae bacterium M2_1C_046]